MAAGLRLELSFPVLETSALANVLTRNIYIQDTHTYDVLPVELLPYMAGEDGTRTHNFRLGMHIFLIHTLLYVPLSYVYIISKIFFIVNYSDYACAEGQNNQPRASLHPFRPLAANRKRDNELQDYSFRSCVFWNPYYGF